MLAAVQYSHSNEWFLAEMHNTLHMFNWGKHLDYSKKHWGWVINLSTVKYSSVEHLDMTEHTSWISFTQHIFSMNMTGAFVRQTQG